MIDFTSYKKEYLKELGNIKDYPPNSLFFSEGLAVYSLAKYFEIDILIESGVFRGGSTSIWIRTLKDISIQCYDILESERHVSIVQEVIDQYQNNPNIKFTIGDSIVEIPKYIESNLDKRVGVFVDGPKEQKGLDLCNTCLSYNNVFFSCLHDFSELNDSKHLSTKTSSKFISLAGNMNAHHPQIAKYPNGPGLYCITKEEVL